MKLDFATTSMLANMALTGTPETQTLSPDEARLMFSEIYRSMPPGPDDIDSETIEIPVDGGRIEARILRPSVDAESLMVYYHGGGWVVGNIDDYDCVGRHLANKCKAVVVLSLIHI